jgi:hypothetical protein
MLPKPAMGIAAFSVDNRVVREQADSLSKIIYGFTILPHVEQKHAPAVKAASQKAIVPGAQFNRTG